MITASLSSSDLVVCDGFWGGGADNSPKYRGSDRHRVLQESGEVEKRTGGMIVAREI